MDPDTIPSPPPDEIWEDVEIVLDDDPDATDEYPVAIVRERLLEMLPPA